MTKTRSTRTSQAEINRLRVRLAEAEETLHAIRTGEVDAIAVDGPHGRQLFTLQSADHPYRILAERMNEGAATLNGAGTILFCNRRLAEMAGLPAERLLGSSLVSILCGQDRPGFPELLRLAGRNDVRAEGRLLRNDGSMLPVQLSLSSIPMEESGPGICLVVTDLQAQKSLEEAARHSETRYRTLVESLPQMVFAKDTNSRYISCNQNFARLLGIRAEEFAGKTDYDFFESALAEKYRADDRRVMQSGVAEEIVEEYKRDGQTMIVQTVKAPLRDADGNTIGVLGVFSDVTARMQAEKKLRERAALLDLAHDAILFRGLDGRILLWNRGAKDLYGWTAEEAAGNVARELLQTVFPETMERIEAVIRKTREWEGELKHICRDGRAIVVASRWSLLRDEQGNPAAIMEINRDITDRKQAEEALRKASHYTRSLIEASVDPLVTISREGKITDVNEATEKVTGVSRQRLIGTDFSNYFTEPEKAREGYEMVFAQGAVHDYPLAIRSASSVVTDVLYNASVFRNEAGEVEGVFAAARDVTERKQAELALTKATLYTRSLIEASLDPLVTISREGKITDVNEATEKVTGVPRQRLIGTDFSDYFTQPEMARRGYRQVFAEGSVMDYPLALRHVSGKLTEVLYNASVFRDQAGEVEGVFAAARDVTERNRAEEEVRKLNEELEQRVAARTEELRVVNKELEAFNYAVAHDLRAPLRHVHGFAEMLAEEARPVLTDSCKHQLDTILDSVQHMSQLLEDLLKLSRLGRQDLSKQACSANSLVAEVINALKPESKGREVEWRITDLPPVECDPALFKQVLMNLLSNALKFTRTRRPAIIEVGQTTIDGEAVIFIRDNGVGFSMNYADKLFGLFQRLHRQQDFEGTGVGLAIVQRIMHRHGGRVWAEAELDKGATFYLSLHRGEAGKKELAAAHAAI